jgi:hypothetical protein
MFSVNVSMKCAVGYVLKDLLEYFLSSLWSFSRVNSIVLEYVP